MKQKDMENNKGLSLSTQENLVDDEQNQMSVFL